MKIVKNVHIPLILISLVAIQTTLSISSLVPSTAEQVTPKELKSSFSDFKHAIKCYWKGTLCSKKDTSTVRNTALFLVLALGILVYRPWQATIVEKDVILHSITTANLPSIKASVSTLKKQRITIPFPEFLYNAFGQLLEVQALQKYPLSPDEVRDLAQQEKAAKEIVRYFIKKTGHETAYDIYSNIQSMAGSLDPATLHQLGLNQPLPPSIPLK